VRARRHTIPTSHGWIAVEECGEGALPVVFIHGNSFCRGVFRHQMQADLVGDYRLLALDLPGHGESVDAVDPVRTYTRPGLADAVIETLGELAVSEAVVIGWSLGGHIGMEMMSRLPGMRGLMITGAPPVGRTNMAEGFIASSHRGLAAREVLSESEIDAFVRAVFGSSRETFLCDAVRRADGQLRKRVFEAARAGAGVDQRLLAETSRVPLAVVNGAADPLINLDYIDTVRYANSWEGRCHRLPGLGHAPFWEAPEMFNPILERFLRDVRYG
jgi:pimeloyl-ACP methyl ester carboxylesterase